MADMRVLDTTMNLDLTHQLLFCSTLRQRRLLDDFGSMNEVGICIHKLEALGKAALS